MPAQLGTLYVHHIDRRQPMNSNHDKSTAKWSQGDGIEDASECPIPKPTPPYIANTLFENSDIYRDRCTEKRPDIWVPCHEFGFPVAIRNS